MALQFAVAGSKLSSEMYLSKCPGVTSFPVCGTLGFTAEPGDNYIGTFPLPPTSLFDCVKSCRRNFTCKAVSYAEEYKLCTFYGKFMKFDHLDADESSNFGHWDEVCSFKREKEGKPGDKHGDGGYES